MNEDGGFRTALFVVDSTPDSGLREAGFQHQASHLSPGELFRRGSHHPYKVTDTVTRSIGQRLEFQLGYRKSNHMNPNWPQQDIFCSRVKEFAEREGLVTARGAIDIEQVSARFDLSPPTLKQFLQNKKRPRPHYDTLAQIAGVVGCDVTEFLDTPNTPPPGISAERWAQASERTRVLSSAMFEDLLKFPEDEQEAYYQLWLKGVAIGLSRREAEAKGKSAEGKKGGKKP